LSALLLVGLAVGATVKNTLADNRDAGQYSIRGLWREQAELLPQAEPGGSGCLAVIPLSE
jgi:hypothetical protein